MKKMGWYGIFLCGVIGCSATTEMAAPDLSNMAHQFVSFGQVHNGMTLDEIEAVIGKQVIVGYELVDEKTGQFKPIVVNNPVRRETVGKYDVAYFFAGIKKADNQVTDEELVPLVFQNDRLVGSGWPFMEAQVKKSK